MKPRVIVHGGASNIADVLVERYKKGTQYAAKAGFEVLKSVSILYFATVSFFLTYYKFFSQVLLFTASGPMVFNGKTDGNETDQKEYTGVFTPPSNTLCCTVDSFMLMQKVSIHGDVSHK